MAETSLIDKKMNVMFSPWKIILGKRMMQFLLLCITVFLLIISSLIIGFLTANGMAESIHINFVFNRSSGLILDFYTVLICLWFLAEIFGIIAICKGKSNLIKIYGTLLFLAFALNAVIGGTMIVSTFYALNNTETKFHQLMRDYDIEDGSKAAIDVLQQETSCCGYFGPSDWYKGFRLSSNLDFDDTGLFLVPRSCCSIYDEGKCISYYSNGCNTILVLILTETIALFFIFLFVSSILMLLGVLAAFRLKRKIIEAEGAKIQTL